MKKIFALALAAVMTAGMTTVAFAKNDQAGLAEHRHHFQGAHQDTAGAQGNGCPPARLCQGDIGA